MKLRRTSLLAALTATGLAAGALAPFPASAQVTHNVNNIKTVVVIYLENWSFDALFGRYPGANGLARATPTQFTQLDRDGVTVMSGLPGVIGGMNSGVSTGAQQAPVNLTQAQTAAFLNTFNHPFTMLSLWESSGNLNDNTPLQYTTRDLYHRFYENQMQINGGTNNLFAAWADSGGLVMGYHEHTNADQPLWNAAQRFVLADNFFQSAFGGSFLNHQYLICSCAPLYAPYTVPATSSVAPGAQYTINGSGNPVNPNTDEANGGGNSNGKAQTPSVVTRNGAGIPFLNTTVSSQASALTGGANAPSFVNSSILTDQQVSPTGFPTGLYMINTSQPPFPPSGNAVGGASHTVQDHVNMGANTTVPPQTQTTIGDLLDAAHATVDNGHGTYAWYAGGMGDYNTPGTAFTLANFADQTGTNVPHFQYHHNPFNYFAKFDPAAKYNPVTGAADNSVAAGAYRAEHLRDGGLSGVKFLADVDAGALPAVTFYKPQGNLNEHPGYTNVSLGDNHVATVLQHLQASPQWANMLVIVTYDEMGGQWDHAAPPKGDFFGPGTRIPAVILSPFAKRGYVDHTQYDTTSILRFITHRWSLPTLQGITNRDNALVSHGLPAMGDLTSALVSP
jgi:acid phosphatase